MEQRESSHENAFVYRANCRQATFGPHNIGFLLARKTIANQILTHFWKNKIHKTFIYRSGRSLSFGEICRCQKNTSRGSSKACPSVARSRLCRVGTGLGKEEEEGLQEVRQAKREHSSLRTVVRLSPLGVMVTSLNEPLWDKPWCQAACP